MMEDTAMRAKKLASLSIFTAIALTIFAIESALPPLLPIPGVKLGLSNIVTLILLLNYKPSDAFLVLLMRILLSGFFAGQMLSILYSLAGGLLCFITMCAVNWLLQKHYIYLTSIIGAVFHNLGQILAACLLTGVSAVILYFPALVISGILTGLFTGLAAHFTQKYLMPHIRL